jgi:hypothetical protein
MRERHHITFAKIRYLLDRPAALVATTLLGNELASVLISHIMANYFNQHFSSPLLASIVNLCLVVPILVLFGEITPKILAALAHEREELEKTGIYFLLTTDQDDQGKYRVYIGETDSFSGPIRHLDCVQTLIWVSHHKYF